MRIIAEVTIHENSHANQRRLGILRGVSEGLHRSLPTLCPVTTALNQEFCFEHRRMSDLPDFDREKLKWIAARLKMGTWKHLNRRLHDKEIKRKAKNAIARNPSDGDSADNDGVPAFAAGQGAR